MQNDESIPVGADAGAANSRPVAAESVTGVDEPGPATMTIPTDAAPEQAALLTEGERLESEAGTENEMIDVHAPHGGLHTWKEFWIHLGTITLGLLIAISLEQTVEYFHHLHQRRDLEASILAECKTNKDRAEADFSGYDDQMKWLLGLHRDIGKLLATGGKADLPYRELRYRPRLLGGAITAGAPGSLVTSVWDTANAGDRLALLPDDEARAYSLLYHVQIAHYEERFSSARDAHMRQTAFEAQFADIARPTTPVLKRMSTDELKQYDAQVMQTFAAVRDSKAGLRLVYGSINATILGRYDPGSRQRTYDAAQAAAADNFASIAREIDADDATRDKAGAGAAASGHR